MGLGRQGTNRQVGFVETSLMVQRKKVKVKVLSESSVGKGKQITSNSYFLRLKMEMHVKTIKCKAIYGLVWFHPKKNPNSGSFNKIGVLFFN